MMASNIPGWGAAGGRALLGVLVSLAAVLVVTAAGRAQAIDRAWLQVEALPDLASAQQRARDYGVDFPNVTGFQLESGWYAILLGPFPAAEAAARLANLRAARDIPGDSYIAVEGNFVRQFWPVGAGTVLAAVPRNQGGIAAQPPVAEPDIAAAIIAPGPVAQETRAEALRGEADLPLKDRQALQTALAWTGFYAAAIDGAFGPGTRSAMAAWQTAQGMAPTGVLTGAQRATLIAGYRADLAELGLETLRDEAMGIEVQIPTALVAFRGYEPPFAHFAPRRTTGPDAAVQVHLISLSGDRSSLFGLYDMLETLEIVPRDGFRERGPSSFVLTGQSATLNSYTYAALAGGLIKGYTLTWDPADEPRMARVLAAMKTSFRAFGDRALDPGMAAPTAEQRRDLLAGLDVRRPKLSRSGFYVDATGRVLTTTTAVRGCGRITIDGATEAAVTAQDTALGVALLTPAGTLAPPGVARLQGAPPRLRADVLVAGYSYGDALSQPTLTFGTVEDVRGLAGEPDLRRLSAAVLREDAGGPVLDASGAVIGMLLPRDDDAGRVLPNDVAFAVGAGPILGSLVELGITPALYAAPGALPPEDLGRMAVAMTVLVSCWD